MACANKETLPFNHSVLGQMLKDTRPLRRMAVIRWLDWNFQSMVMRTWRPVMSNLAMKIWWSVDLLLVLSKVSKRMESWRLLSKHTALEKSLKKAFGVLVPC